MEEIEACIADPNTVEAEIEARELASISPIASENFFVFIRIPLFLLNSFSFSDGYGSAGREHNPPSEAKPAFDLYL